MSAIVNRGFFILAGFATIFLVYVIWRYLTLGTYVDHAEPDIAINAWAFLSDQPLYQEPGTQGYVLYPYGPLLYLANALMLGLFGPSIVVSKLANAIACLAAVGLFIVYLHRRFGWSDLGVGLLAFVCYLLIGAPVSFWVRPESLVVLTVMLGLLSTLAADRGRPWVTVACVAICAGLSMNLKIHSFIFFVPLVIRYCSTRWMVFWPVMGAIAVATFLLPFASPSISVINYVLGLQDFLSYRDSSLGALQTAVKYSLVFYLPGLMLVLAVLTRRDQLDKRDLVYFAAYAICLSLTIYPASVSGSTWRQMLPFFPLSIDLGLRFARTMRGNRQVWLGGHTILVLTLIILSVTPQKRLLRAFLGIEKWSHATADEVTLAIENNPRRTLQMGYNYRDDHDYRFTFVRPLLVFAGSPQTISAVDAMERGLAGRQASAWAIHSIRYCETDVWLVPRGSGRNFSLRSYYGGRAFPIELERVFAESYEKVATGNYFETWACRR